MSTILLVRHGQARWGARDYDALSELGARQCGLLGRALTARGVQPRLVVAGGMRRHLSSAEAVCRAAGWGLDVELDRGWDEYPHQDIIAVHKPAYRNQVVMKADLVRTLHPRIHFQAMFDKALERWSTGEHDADYRESFAQFCSRTEVSLAELSTRLGPDDSAVVVTSAGPVAWAVTSLLQAGPQTWRVLNLSMVNTGVTKVSSVGDRLLVSTVNSFAHLESDPDPEIVTTR